MEADNNKPIEVQAVKQCLAHDNATREKQFAEAVYSRSISAGSDNFAAILTVAEEYAADIAGQSLRRER